MNSDTCYLPWKNRFVKESSLARHGPPCTSSIEFYLLLALPSSGLNVILARNLDGGSQYSQRNLHLFSPKPGGLSSLRKFLYCAAKMIERRRAGRAITVSWNKIKGTETLEQNYWFIYKLFVHILNKINDKYSGNNILCKSFIRIETILSWKFL